MRAARKSPALPHFDKWELFRETCAARSVLGVSSRNLAVLNALLTFDPDRALSDKANLVVFPSNASLSDRAHGMAESSLRRNLAALVAAGLIRRHDKRYAARGADGEVCRASGFDLRPLLVRADEIQEAAAIVRSEQEHLKRVREDVSLLKRDAVKLVAYGREESPGAVWTDIDAALLDVHRRMRRGEVVLLFRPVSRRIKMDQGFI